MSEDHIKVTFTCKTCGGTILSLPDDHTDDSIASCKACGQEFGRFGDIKAKAREAALADMQGRIRDIFKGRKGWKLK
ncbi:hypothetical protein D3C72_2281390 [compost metagenome]